MPIWPCFIEVPLLVYPTGTMPAVYEASPNGIVESGCRSPTRTVRLSIFLSFFGSTDVTPVPPSSASFLVVSRCSE